MRRERSDAGFTVVELIVAATILAIALAMIGNYIISASKNVATSTAHQDDNAAAQITVDQLGSNIRFACNMSISAGTLFVANSYGACTTQGQPACAEWSSTGGALTERSTSGTSTIANGVSGLTFTSNSSYNGLVTIQFTLRQPKDASSDPGGVLVNQTLSARNMSTPVATGLPLIGCP